MTATLSRPSPPAPVPPAAQRHVPPADPWHWAVTGAVLLAILAAPVIGWTLLALFVAFALLVTIVPRFLDRVYYRGPATDHFDGERFFNPDGDADTIRPPAGGSRGGFFWRFLTGSDGRPPWPASVAVTPAKPERRVEGEDPAVDLGDRRLLRGGVLLLDDADHLAGVIAQDPAVPVGVRHHTGQDAHHSSTRSVVRSGFSRRTVTETWPSVATSVRGRAEIGSNGLS